MTLGKPADTSSHRLHPITHFHKLVKWILCKYKKCSCYSEEKMSIEQETERSLSPAGLKEEHTFQI